MKALKQILWGKLESTYATDSVPLGTTDAIVAQNVKLERLKGKAQKRSGIRASLGSVGYIYVGEHLGISFEVEMFASGVAGTAPAYGSIMKACAQSEAVVAATSVTYAGIDTAEQSMTFYFNRDGKLHKLTGARGDVSTGLSSEGIPVWKYSFIGLYNGPTDTAMSASTLTAYKKPLPISSKNTTASIHGYAGLVSAFDFALGNKNTYRDDINGEGVYFTDRAVTGSVTLQEVSVATKDWDAIILNETLGAVSITHGSVAGSKVGISGTNVQIIGISDADLGGIQGVKLDLDFQDYAIVYN